MKYLWATIFLCIIVSACSSTRLSHAEKNAIIEDFIQSEALKNQGSISSFSMRSWTSLNEEYLILHSSPNRPYLVKLFMRCYDLDFSPILLVHSRSPNLLTTGFDSVMTPDSGNIKCQISRIYPLTREQYTGLLQNIRVEAEEKELKAAQEQAEKNSTKAL